MHIVIVQGPFVLSKFVYGTEFRKKFKQVFAESCIFVKKSLYTVLILPSCIEEKDEDDFDKKKKRPSIKERNYRQPSCLEGALILPWRYFYEKFILVERDSVIP